MVGVTLRIERDIARSLWTRQVETSFEGRVGDWLFVAMGESFFFCWLISDGGGCLHVDQWSLVSEGDFDFLGVVNEDCIHHLGQRGGVWEVFIFLGGIMGLVVRADMVGTKCWVQTRGPSTRGQVRQQCSIKYKVGVFNVLSSMSHPRARRGYL